MFNPKKAGIDKSLASCLLLLSIIGLGTSIPVFSALSGQWVISSTGTIAVIQPLHVEGQYVMDEADNIIYLRGVNAGAWVDTYTGGWTPVGGYYGDSFWNWNPDALKANLDQLQSWGVTFVRSLACIDYWKYDTNNFRQHYKDFATWAAQRGIYVLLGFWSLTHYDDDAWSDWTNFPYPPWIPSEYDYIIPNKQAFVDVWEDMATEFADYNNVLFTLWNEVGADTGDAELEDWWPVAQDCIVSIRNHCDHIIVVENGYGIYYDFDYPNPEGSVLWIQDCPLTDTEGNLIYDTHIYRDGGGMGYNVPTGGGEAYTYDDIRAAFEGCYLNTVGENWSKPLIIGEIGANMGGGQNEFTAFENALTILNEMGIGYCAWIWQPVGLYPLLEDEAYPASPSTAGQILIEAISTT